MNNSGLPGKAKVSLNWSQGALKELTDQVYDPVPGIYHTHKVKLRLRDGPALARLITLRYSWIGGGVLTQDDLEYIHQNTRGVFRSAGQEFAGVWVAHELRSISMLVRIPPAFAPAPSGPALTKDSVSIPRARRWRDEEKHVWRSRTERKMPPFPRRTTTTARTPAIAEGEPSVRVTPLEM